MAVIDHEHVKLRLLYSRKKKLDKTVETLKNETDELKGMLQDVRQFCIKEGIDSSRIDSLLGKFAPRRRKDSKFYTLVKLVMSTASINNNDNDSISSSSMENDLRDYANRQSVLNEAASNEGTVSSLRQYLSVPFFSKLPAPGSSAVSSDQDSVSCGGSMYGGGGARPSIEIDSVFSKPSIFITAPPSDDLFSPDDDLDLELGGQRSLSGSDVEGSIGSDGDVDDDNYSDVFEEDEQCREKKVFLKDKRSSCMKPNSDGDFDHAAGKTEVAFYLGSQASLEKLNFPADGSASKESACVQNPPPGNNAGGRLGEGSSCQGGADVLIVPNKNLQPTKYGRFLTVPMCTVPASSVTTRVLLSNMNSSNKNNNTISNSINNNEERLSNMQENKDAVESIFPGREHANNESSASSLLGSKPDTTLTTTSSGRHPPIPDNVTEKQKQHQPSLSTADRRKQFASSSFSSDQTSSFDIDLIKPSAEKWMKRSLSDYTKVGSPEYPEANLPLLNKDLSHRVNVAGPSYGSPVPRRRLPELRTRRKAYATVRCRSDSEESDLPKPPLCDSPEAGRERRVDFDTSISNNSSSRSSNIFTHPHSKHQRRRHHSERKGDCVSVSEKPPPYSSLPPRSQDVDANAGERARSQSPSLTTMSLLQVPGYEERRRSLDSYGGHKGDNQGIKFVSSQSMTDIPSDGNGNPFANNIDRDGKILRSSCLSLNSARHKRRGKSPHRVSFKVS
ncbi:hypothetical protein PoB_002528600 [Plakobranchus ocellatus]|uniref:Shugoshin C-terminal domain-containing protein n=1 Tax=Plakobranchus ocellatus TaxID=259542 RepID=A0AAV3ZI20_9GAST|nr:hypothetical protein PoB_002528600 [Plakobranchus ocellatus]